MQDTRMGDPKGASGEDGRSWTQSGLVGDRPPSLEFGPLTAPQETA